MRFSFRHILTRRHAGGPGDLQVEAAGVGIAVDDLAGEIQAGNLLGFHGLGVDLAAFDAAGPTSGSLAWR